MHLHTKAFPKYFVLQSLHKALPSTTLYYKACTKHFPVLLCTTKLAQNTFQCYFVIQSLHKARPSTTMYYKACTNHCGVWSASVKCGVWSAKSAVWSVRKVFAWCCIAPGSRAGHVLGQHLFNSFAHSTHARAWLAHGACKFYSTSLRQLPPRFVYYWYFINL